MLSDIRNRKNAGVEFNIPPNGKGMSLFNNTGSAIVLGEVVWIDYEETADEEICAEVVANKTFPVRTAVAIEAIDQDKIGYFQIEGKCNALVYGGAIGAGDYLDADNTQVYFVKDGASRTVVSAAVALEAWATASSALKSVFLIGEQHTIA